MAALQTQMIKILAFIAPSDLGKAATRECVSEGQRYVPLTVLYLRAKWPA